MCADTNVSPSHATPSTHTAAAMPDLNVDISSNRPLSKRHDTTIMAAMPIMKPIIAPSRGSTGSLIRPMAGEIAQAYSTTASTPAQKISTERLAVAGSAAITSAERGGATNPAASRS